MLAGISGDRQNWTLDSVIRLLLTGVACFWVSGMSRHSSLIFMLRDCACGAYFPRSWQSCTHVDSASS